MEETWITVEVLGAYWVPQALNVERDEDVVRVDLDTGERVRIIVSGDRSEELATFIEQEIAAVIRNKFN
jgi:hypothetical protein